ncbi:MAG: hypothetical protein AB7F64_07425, partial [Gammaproteobacteria bacterium]
MGKHYCEFCVKDRKPNHEDSTSIDVTFNFDDIAYTVPGMFMHYLDDYEKHGWKWKPQDDFVKRVLKGGAVTIVLTEFRDVDSTASGAVRVAPSELNDKHHTRHVRPLKEELPHHCLGYLTAEPINDDLSIEKKAMTGDSLLVFIERMKDLDQKVRTLFKSESREETISLTEISANSTWDSISAFFSRKATWAGVAVIGAAVIGGYKLSQKK